MRKMLFLLAVAGAMSLAAPTPALAATYPHIARINRKTHTVSLAVGPTKTDQYTVTPQTQIFVNGRPRLFRALRRGMKASISHKPDSTAADLIDAHSRSRVSVAVPI
jgi:hypothetical protein